MDEPTYHYVKGQGWITTTGCESISGVTNTNKKFTLINRPPEMGEFFVQVYRYNPEYVIDSKVVRLSKVVKWLAEARPNFEHFTFWKQDTKILPDYICVVLVIENNA